MIYVLLKSFSYVAIILIGIFMKYSGFLPENAGHVINKIVVRLTLPAAIVVSFSNVESMESKMILIALAGMFMSIIMMVFGAVITRGKERKTRVLHMLCLPSFNVGSFIMPFTQACLPPIGTVTSCVFDVGNGFMCTGANYPIVSQYLSEDKDGFHIWDFVKRLLSSPPLVIYVLLFALSLLGIQVPAVITDFIAPIGNANPFMAMLMLGLLFHWEPKREYMIPILKILGMRQVFSVICAVFFYFCMPFELAVRQALVLVCFAPMSAIAPAYVSMCNGDEGMASCANSMSVILSVTEILCLLVILGLY